MPVEGEVVGGGLPPGPVAGARPTKGGRDFSAAMDRAVSRRPAQARAAGEAKPDGRGGWGAKRPAICLSQ